MNEMEKDCKNSMKKKISIPEDQVTDLRDIKENLLRFMRHITVSPSDLESQRYQKAVQKMAHLNKIQAEKLKENVDKITKEETTESERSIISKIRSSQIKCILNLDHAVEYL